MSKWNMIIDVAECTNCNLCTLATMDEYVDNDWPGYAAPMPKHGHKWIDIKQKERGQAPFIDIAYLPTTCNHCDNAPCMAAAPDAVTKREDGIVLIDPVKAKGRRDLVESCPYGAIYWNAEKEIPQHWIFDAHLLDQGWKQPRCVTVCATNALMAVKVEDYIEAAAAVGNPRWRIAVKHILPNILPALLVQATLAIATAIIAEAALSFLGLGQQPPAPSWGSMLNVAKNFLEQAPWMALWPGIAIFMVVLGFNLLGDGLRDALDPREL